MVHLQRVQGVDLTVVSDNGEDQPNEYRLALLGNIAAHMEKAVKSPRSSLVMLFNHLYGLTLSADVLCNGSIIASHIG